MPPKTPNALLHGALDALILKTLAPAPRHGYAIARFIEDRSPSSAAAPSCIGLPRPAATS